MGGGLLAEAPAASRSRAWWLPSLTEVVFVAVLLWVLVAGQASVLLADGDTGWHIRVGDYILAEGRIPAADLFSFSRPGAEWFAWEWGSDVLFALAHRAAGLAGVALLGGVLIAATSAALFHFLIWQRVNVLVAVVAMFVAASASTVHWLARPHLFTCLLFVLALWLLEADRRQPTRWVWALAPVAAMWANLHGGFVVLLATLCVYSAGSLVEVWRGSPPRRWARPRRYGLLMLAAAAASLFNAYGYQLHLHVFRYLNSNFIRDQVEEFQSPRFRGESMLAFELLLIAGLLAVPRLWRRRDYAAALLVLGLAHAALGSVRHVLLYALAATPALALLLSEAVGKMGGRWGAALASLSADYAPQDRPAARLAPPLWAAAAILLAAALLCSGHPRWRADFPPEKFPHRALAASEEKLVRQRVLTTDQWGSYLLYRYYPQIRVFIDGRSDFYGPEIGRQYLEMLGANHRWEQILDRHGFDVVLLPPQWPLATLLKAHPGWRLDYDDGQALLLRRVWRGAVPSANSTSIP